MARPRTYITLRYIYKRRDIKEGRGKHFVEFDASSSEVTVVTNPITGATEHIFLAMFCLIIEILFLAHYEQSRY